MRVAVSNFMSQNMKMAKEINKDRKKYMYKAAISVQMQLPGSLSVKSVDSSFSQLQK